MRRPPRRSWLGLPGPHLCEQVGGDRHEDGFGGSEDLTGCIGKLRFDVIAAAGDSCVSGGESKRHTKRDGAEVVDFEMAGHGEDAAGSVRFAHGFIKKGGDDAAVGVAGRSGEACSEAEMAGDVVVFVGEELKAEAGAVFESAAEAVVEGAVGRGVGGGLGG
jgi:hypothetical protein